MFMEITSVTGFIAGYIYDQEENISLDLLKKHIFELSFW